MPKQKTPKWNVDCEMIYVTAMQEDQILAQILMLNGREDVIDQKPATRWVEIFNKELERRKTIHRRTPTYVRHSTVPISNVVSTIRAIVVGTRRKQKWDFNGQTVGISSLRLQTFAEHGTTCKCCGLEATHFAIERNLTDEKNNAPYHLNLYGVNQKGEEVLFTHDHKLARALGGRDAIDNTQTMCCFCNWTKGDEERILVDEKRKNGSQ